MMRTSEPPHWNTFRHVSGGRAIGDRLLRVYRSVCERRKKMIELMTRARRLCGEITPVVCIDGPLQRDAAGNLDAGLGEAVKLGWIVRQQQHARAAEDLQHAHGDAVVALVVIETERRIGV